MKRKGWIIPGCRRGACHRHVLVAQGQLQRHGVAPRSCDGSIGKCREPVSAPNGPDPESGQYRERLRLSRAKYIERGCRSRAQATQTRIDVNDAAAMARFAPGSGRAFLGTEPSDGHFGKLSRSEGQSELPRFADAAGGEPENRDWPSSAASITRLPSRSIPISKCSRAICSPACSVLLR